MNSIVSGFVDGTSDIDTVEYIAKSMDVPEELLKSVTKKVTAGKVYRRVMVTPKRGKPFMRNQLVNVEDNSKPIARASKHEDDVAKKPRILVDGPRDTKQFIEDYVERHPEIKKEFPKYKGVLSKVKEFNKNKPEEGTYDAVTGKKLEYSSGFCVTFHQNLSMDDPFGAYTDDTYAAMCAIAKRELNADSVNIGVFGNAEVSFVCDSGDQAMRFAIEHNQHSIFDSSIYETLENPKYNPKTNPIER